MDYNYHTHTFRCSHATGSEEEYIKTAIDGGVKFMGFSDHAPFKFDDGYEALYRVPMDKAQDYFNVIGALREKYKDKINIKIGFEMEYYPTHFAKMLENVLNLGAEYLILGQHFVNEEYPYGTPSSAASSYEELKDYVSSVVSGIESGYFSYVAHPDIIAFNGNEDLYTKEMRKICVASSKHGIPLEINFLGIRANRTYPKQTFWEIAAQEKSPVTFGFDAHDVESAYDIKSYEKAMAMVNDLGLNYIGMSKIIDIRK